MENKRSGIRTTMAVIGGVVVIAVLIFILQLPGLSIRGLVTGERVLGGGQFWLLEFIAGALTSAIITGVAVLLFRRLMLWVGALSVVLQSVWLVLTQTFHAPADSLAEILFRSAEFAGIIAGAAIAIFVARGIFNARATPAKT
jgi:hypothetical protein